MLRTVSVAALAAVCVSAFAQNDSTPTTTTTTTTTSTTTYQNPSMTSWDTTNMKWHDIRMAIDRDFDSLRPGDKFYLTSWLDRLPSNKEMVVLKALANVHNNAIIVHDQMAMRTTTTTTTTTTPTDTTSTTYSSSEDSVRPMRMIMERPEPREVNYGEALKTLSAGLNSTEQAQLASLFYPTPWASQTWSSSITLAPEHERAIDVLTRWVANCASMADMGRTYSSTTPSTSTYDK